MTPRYQGKPSLGHLLLTQVSVLEIERQLDNPAATPALPLGSLTGFEIITSILDLNLNFAIFFVLRVTVNKFLSPSEPQFLPVLSLLCGVQMRSYIWCLVHCGCSISVIYLPSPLALSPFPILLTNVRKGALFLSGICTLVQTQPEDLESSLPLPTLAVHWTPVS